MKTTCTALIGEGREACAWSVPPVWGHPPWRERCMTAGMCLRPELKNFCVTGGAHKDSNKPKGQSNMPFDSKEVNGLFPLCFSLYPHPRSKMFHFQESSSNLRKWQAILLITCCSAYVCLLITQSVWLYWKIYLLLLGYMAFNLEDSVSSCVLPIRSNFFSFCHSVFKFMTFFFNVLQKCPVFFLSPPLPSFLSPPSQQK